MARSAGKLLLKVLLIALALIALGTLYWLALSGSGRSGANPEQIPEQAWTPGGPPLDTAHLELVRRAVGPDGLLAIYMERYRREVGRYPERLEELLRSHVEASGRATWSGPYLQNPELLDDPWNRQYQYRAPGTHNPNAYDLWSVGPDGKDGTGDEIGNW